MEMSNSKYANIWRLLNEYNFIIDIQKNSELICSICQNLLRNAQQGICGCLYCYECIKNYMTTDEKYCPGKNGDCKELMITVELNMQVDHSTNRKISCLEVDCPMQFCEHRIALKMMEEHIKSHHHNGNVNKSSYIIDESLDKLKQEISSLREDFNENKKDTLSNEIMVMKMRVEIDTLKRRNQAFQKEIKKLKEEVKNTTVVADNVQPIANVANDSLADDIEWEIDLFTEVDTVDCIDQQSSDNNKHKRIDKDSSIDDELLNDESLVSYDNITISELKNCIQSDLQQQYEEIRQIVTDHGLLIKKLQDNHWKTWNNNESVLDSIDLTSQDTLINNSSMNNYRDKDYSIISRTKTTAAISSGKQLTTITSSDNPDNQTPRRRLKRELPKLTNSSNDTNNTNANSNTNANTNANSNTNANTNSNNNDDGFVPPITDSTKDITSSGGVSTNTNIKTPKSPKRVENSKPTTSPIKSIIKSKSTHKSIISKKSPIRPSLITPLMKCNPRQQRNVISKVIHGFNRHHTTTTSPLLATARQLSNKPVMHPLLMLRNSDNKNNNDRIRQPLLSNQDNLWNTISRLGPKLNKRSPPIADKPSLLSTNLHPMLLGVTNNINKDNSPWTRNYSPYEVIVDNFAHKVLQSKVGLNPSIVFPPFYSNKNGYKLALRIDPHGHGLHHHKYLGVFFCVLRGENDDQLPWPMRMEVTISLMDQITSIPYTSRTFDFATAPDNWKHVFNRPIVDDSYWFGTPQFIHFDFLYSNSALVHNDSIVIRCSTGPVYFG